MLVYMKLKNKNFNLKLLLIFFLLVKAYYLKKIKCLRKNYDLNLIIRDKTFFLANKNKKIYTKIFYGRNRKSNTIFYKKGNYLFKWFNLANRENIKKKKNDFFLNFYNKKQKKIILYERINTIENNTLDDQDSKLDNLNDEIFLDSEEKNSNEELNNESKINKNIKKNKKRHYKFTSWNNTKEINKFDLEKYNIDNELTNDESQKYHSAYYSFVINNSNDTNHLNIKINKELVNSLSVEELLNVLIKYNENSSKQKKKNIFNEVNIVTAYHRIAKHVRNKNFYQKKNLNQENETDSYFDPVTFSLFENYSNVSDIEEKSNITFNSSYDNNKVDENTENHSNESSKKHINEVKLEDKSENSGNTERSNEENYSEKSTFLTEANSSNVKINDKDNKIKKNKDFMYNNHENLSNIKIYSYIYELLKNNLVDNSNVITKHVANIAWASAILSNKDMVVWSNIKKQFYENINSFKAQELSIIIWSFSATKNELIKTKEEFILLYNCIKKYINENKFKAQEFSNIIWSFGISKYCNLDLLIILYNYALKIFDKLLLKDISTVLYSLSIFASDCINQNILETIKKRHFDLYNIHEDYLTIRKTEKKENQEIFNCDKFYFFNHAVNNYENPTENNLIEDDNANDKKYVFFLLFENFLKFSLKKINNEKDKMTMRSWSNIFWSCANVGLGLYKDIYSDHKDLKYYIYMKSNEINGEAVGNVNINILNTNNKDNKNIIHYKKENDSLYYIFLNHHNYECLHTNVVYEEDKSLSIEKVNYFFDCKPYVHIINKEYIFPAISYIHDDEYKIDEKQKNKFSLNIDLDIFNNNKNKIEINDHNYNKIMKSNIPTDENLINDAKKKENKFNCINNQMDNSFNINEEINLTSNNKLSTNNGIKCINGKQSTIDKNSNSDILYKSSNLNSSLNNVNNSNYLKIFNILNDEENNIYNETNNNNMVLTLLELFQSQLKEKIIKWKKCETQSIANILWSLSVLNVFSKNIFENGLSECNKRFIKNSRKRNSNKLQKYISQLHQSQLYQASFSFCLYILNSEKNSNKLLKSHQDISNCSLKSIDTKKKIQLIFEKYFNVSITTLNIWRKQLARNQRKEEKNQISSSAHKKISDELKQLNIFHYNEYFLFDSILVDIYIPHSKIVIEIDGPSHFFQKGKKIIYNPNSLFKKRLLRALGFVVISISISNHTFMFSSLNTINFIKKILNKVNYNI
ncbi:RAP protein, putative [Plasmodium gallinaceum]|uniref:RAP protein, putative n=1 Tax=Plasmodium gallinaceum TaxID=5849 RepID=A0A1J1H3N3_PLAGA|nr:RAP protein, putative [Plasmodium gallinaceum]CRG97960.1 RAP protein, putative [Plasmodium gallinaceum]